jgi:hypothetical protein
MKRPARKEEPTPEPRDEDPVAVEIFAACARGVGQISRWLTGRLGETAAVHVETERTLTVSGGGRTYRVTVTREK